jgi:hypothetical protein
VKEGSVTLILKIKVLDILIYTYIYTYISIYIYMYIYIYYMKEGSVTLILKINSFQQSADGEGGREGQIIFIYYIICKLYMYMHI